MPNVNHKLLLFKKQSFDVQADLIKFAVKTFINTNKENYFISTLIDNNIVTRVALINRLAQQLLEKIKNNNKKLHDIIYSVGLIEFTKLLKNVDEDEKGAKIVAENLVNTICIEIETGIR